MIRLDQTVERPDQIRSEARARGSMCPVESVYVAGLENAYAYASSITSSYTMHASTTPTPQPKISNLLLNALACKVNAPLNACKVPLDRLCPKALREAVHKLSVAQCWIIHAFAFSARGFVPTPASLLPQCTLPLARVSYNTTKCTAMRRCIYKRRGCC